MTEARPLVLLTNDDGIDAPGLRALRVAFEPVARTIIVAPDGECSAVGHSISIRKPMPYRVVLEGGREWGHALRGSPADCVKLALTWLLEEPPALVVSGVNPGANLGHNIFYSGTAAAAREAAMLGVPAFAVSVQSEGKPAESLHFETPARYAARLAARVMREGLPDGVILNINAPNLAPEAIRGARVSRQGRTMFVDRMAPTGEHGDVRAFTNVGDRVIRSPEDHVDADDLVVGAGFISVTPLHFDMTFQPLLAELARRLPEDAS